jgi:alkylated DNA repair protein alkB family protein 4
MTEWKSLKPIYVFCPICGDKAWTNESHEFHNEISNLDSVNIGGVHVIENFISPEEEQQLIQIIDTKRPWVDSQEGRRKQDYGPKVSFLKRKVSVGNFGGLPRFAVNLFDRMSASHSNLMKDFVPVEFCVLEYTPERGSYIRPHYDDMWIWGDRLITVNLLSDTVLRLTREFKMPPYEIVIRMPARSLIIITGEARYDWHHSINRYDIKSRRVAMTWREFGDEIVHDGEYKDFVTEVFQLASQIDDT